GPATIIFEGLGQIPVIESNEGANLGFQQGIYEAAVVVDALGVGVSGTGGLNARPGEGKAVAVQVHGPHQFKVVTPAVIGVAGYIAGAAIFDFAGSVGEAIPDGFTLAVGFPCAFDLVSSSGRAPEEVLGKRNLGSR